MAKNSLESIRKFTEPKEFAFVGISRDPKKFSRAIYKDLEKKGIKMHPVNPKLDDLDGNKVYHSIAELPAGITHALIMTPKKETAAAVEEGIKHGITNFWIQQGAETPEAVELARKSNVNLVQKACIMMYSDPVHGVHGFHRFMAKIFGGYARN